MASHFRTAVSSPSGLWQRASWQRGHVWQRSSVALDDLYQRIGLGLQGFLDPGGQGVEGFAPVEGLQNHERLAHDVVRAESQFYWIVGWLSSVTSARFVWMHWDIIQCQTPGGPRFVVAA